MKLYFRSIHPPSTIFVSDKPTQKHLNQGTVLLQLTFSQPLDFTLIKLQFSDMYKTYDKLFEFNAKAWKRN